MLGSLRKGRNFCGQTAKGTHLSCFILEHCSESVVAHQREIKTKSGEGCYLSTDAILLMLVSFF